MSNDPPMPLNCAEENDTASQLPLPSVSEMPPSFGPGDSYSQQPISSSQSFSNAYYDAYNSAYNNACYDAYNSAYNNPNTEPSAPADNEIETRFEHDNEAGREQHASSMRIRPVSPSTLIALTEPFLMDWCLEDFGDNSRPPPVREPYQENIYPPNQDPSSSYP